jgi:uncharacterized protein (DUF1015 family)
LADIRPFQGVHYNPALVKDLARVICPPYDVIPAQTQQRFYQRSDHNFIRIEFGRELPQDSINDNRYTRAAAALDDWLKEGILEIDSEPSLYITDQHFNYQGKAFRRRHLNCLVKLEEWNKMIVRPHEGTLNRPKNDRLNLLWAIQANTSPIMALYEDRDKLISSLINRYARGRPALHVRHDNGESHEIWGVSDTSVIDQVRSYLAAQPLYIADGHHRYESALNYRRERHTGLTAEAAESPFDFVMMSLVDIDDPGLVILPAHRLVRGISTAAIEELATTLQNYFTVAEIPAERVNNPTRLEDLVMEGENEVKLLVFGLKKDSALLLTLRDFSRVHPMMPYFHSDLYQKLDVSIVDHVILEGLLGLTHEKAGVFIDYTNEALEAIKRVDDHEYQLACIINPVKPGIIKAIADCGDRMPRKSTYFFPKIPAGLVFYRFGL